MKETCFRHQMTDGTIHHIYRFEPQDWTNINGVIHLIHGSCEHAGRYRTFAEWMTNHGFIVIANDLRGHGLTAESKEELGFFAKHDGWEKMLSDLLEVNTLIRQDYPGTRIYMLGHSMGSFLARHYALIHGETIDALLAIGTAHHSSLELKAGIVAAQLGIYFKDRNAPAHFLNKMTYEAFNKKIKDPRTKSDWLTHDTAVVDAFLKDDRAGFPFTYSAFRDMFCGLLFITDPQNIRQGSPSLPILLLGGSNDPVSKNGKQVEKAYHAYKKAGIKKIDIKLYPNMRHEILNEIGKEEVFQDIADWLGVNGK